MVHSWPVRCQTLPGHAGQKLPMTYRGSDRQQYVASMATGNSFASQDADDKPRNEEALIAFALPQ